MARLLPLYRRAGADPVGSSSSALTLATTTSATATTAPLPPLPAAAAATQAKPTPLALATTATLSTSTMASAAASPIALAASPSPSSATATLVPASVGVQSLAGTRLSDPRNIFWTFPDVPYDGVLVFKYGSWLPVDGSGPVGADGCVWIDYDSHMQVAGRWTPTCDSGHPAAWVWTVGALWSVLMLVGLGVAVRVALTRYQMRKHEGTRRPTSTMSATTMRRAQSHRNSQYSRRSHYSRHSHYSVHKDEHLAPASPGSEAALSHYTNHSRASHSYATVLSPSSLPSSSSHNIAYHALVPSSAADDVHLLHAPVSPPMPMSPIEEDIGLASPTLSPPPSPAMTYSRIPLPRSPSPSRIPLPRSPALSPPPMSSPVCDDDDLTAVNGSLVSPRLNAIAAPIKADLATTAGKSSTLAHPDHPSPPSL
ncbi:hypothetical protein BC828DRAFT_253603 [Blastocladiella britannica]|nr:hypothetical protein BC828DRAFT_253603 [Blastocladiella britannica]